MNTLLHSPILIFLLVLVIVVILAVVLSGKKTPVQAPTAQAAPNQAPERAEGPELIAVIAAAVAMMAEQDGRKYVLRAFRPAGAASTAWSRAGR